MSKKENKTNREIQVGDVVKLKSGGAKMTVVGLEGFSTAVQVVFFDNESRLIKATIGVQGLNRAK